MADLYDDDRWDLYGLLREVYLGITAAIDADIDTPELSDDMQDLMLRLARTPGRTLRPTDITRATGSTPSSTTRLLAAAEEDGIIERLPDPDDRRGLLVHLTASGKRRTDRWAKRGLAATVTHLNDRLTGPERRQLEAILRKLRDPEHDGEGKLADG